MISDTQPLQGSESTKVGLVFLPQSSLFDIILRHNVMSLWHAQTSLVCDELMKNHGK